MIDSTTVSSVHAVDYRSIMTNKTPGLMKPADKTVGKTRKPSGQDMEIHTDKSMHGALAKLRDGMQEFTTGVLRPKTGVVGEKTYKTSVSQAKENLSKEHIGALTGFYDRVHGFAFGIMRPETGIIGEKTYDSANSMTLTNLGKDYFGALTGFHDKIDDFKFGILRPESGLIGDKTFDSAQSMTMDNLSRKHVGAAAGIKNTILQYKNTFEKTSGPSVKVLESAVPAGPDKILQHEIPTTSAADDWLQDTPQYIDVSV